VSATLMASSVEFVSGEDALSTPEHVRAGLPVRPHAINSLSLEKICLKQLSLA
jgi:hypothetical protein